MAVLLGDLMFRPNAYMFSTGGDGLKNYFTAQWALSYDRGIHFSGMNHPYGEHLTYTDAQPILIGVFRILERIGIPVQGYLVGWMNALMMLSLVPTALILRRLGTHYGLPHPWAIGFALLATLLSPQIQRWMGHYALGYTFFVPLLWYLVLQMQGAARGNSNGFQRVGEPLIWTGVLLAVLLAFGMLHLYYLLIGLACLGAYAIFLSALAWLNPADRRFRFKQAARALGAGLLAFAAMWLFIRLTDGVGDRPASPYGFTQYRASWYSVFTSQESFWWKDLEDRIALEPEMAEGLAYVGLPAALLLPLILLRQLLRLFRRSAWRNGLRGFIFLGRMVLPGDFGIWLLSGLAVLFLAMALPFRWGLEWMLDELPLIKQFRSPGRLVMVFYPVWTLFAALMVHRLYRLLRMKKRPVLASLLLALVLITWSVDALSNLSNFREKVFEPNLFLRHNFSEHLQDRGLSPEHFQGILCIPFYHMGSEKLYIDRGASALVWGMQAALQTGIPMINVMMSRTSLEQTLANTSLVSRYGPLPGALEEFDERAILLLTNRALDDARIQQRERQLLAMAELVFAGPDYSLWSIQPGQFAEGTQAFPPKFPEERVLLYADDFEAGSMAGLFGRAEYRQEGLWLLTELELGERDGTPDSLIEVSVWVKAFLEYCSFPNIKLEWLDDQKQVLWTGYISTKESSDVWIDWVEARRVLEPMSNAAYLRVSAEGEAIGLDALRIQRSE